MASRDEVTLDRAMRDLGTKLGVKEDVMGKEMKKTAEAVAYSGTGAALDAGDYGTQAEAVGAQSKETREPGAPAEPDRKGSQVQTVNPANDGSYSLDGSAKLGELDPKTAAQVISIMDRATRGLMKHADDTTTPASGGQMPGTGGATVSPADGPEIGGAPDPNAEMPDAGLAAAPGQPAGTTDALIQQKITEYEEKIQSDKTVVDALQDIASQAGVPTLAAKPTQAAIPNRHSSAASSGASSGRSSAASAKTSAIPPRRSSALSSARSSEGSAPSKTSAIPPRHRSSGSSGGRTSMWSSAKTSRSINLSEQNIGDTMDPGNTKGVTTPQGFAVSPETGKAVYVGVPPPSNPAGAAAGQAIGDQISGKGRGIPGRFSSGASSGRSSASSARSSAGGRGPASSAASSAKTSMYRQGADATMTTPGDLPYRDRNAQVDINDMTLAKDPDNTLYTQSKGKSDGTPSPNMPQEFGPGSDKDYVLASRRYNRAVFTAASKMKAVGMTKEQAQQTLADTVIHRGWLALDAAKGQAKFASVRYYQELNKMVAAGHTYEAAKQAVQKRHGMDIKMSSHRFKQALRGFVPMLVQAEQELAPQDVDIPGGSHPEYTGNDAGDRGADLITPGNVDTLVSPETQAVETQADQTLDSRHNDDIAGSVTTARLTRQQAQPALTAMKTLLATAEKLGGIPAMWQKRATSNQTVAVLAQMTKRAVTMKSTADQIEKLLRLGAKGGNIQRINAGLVNAVKVADSQVRMANEMIATASVFGSEVAARESKLARLAPAMTLALQLHTAGHLDATAIPTKMAEFINMTGGEFKVAAKMVQGLQPANRGMGKSAVRLPRYTGGDPTNELDGIFE